MKTFISFITTDLAGYSYYRLWRGLKISLLHNFHFNRRMMLKDGRSETFAVEVSILKLSNFLMLCKITCFRVFKHLDTTSIKLCETKRVLYYVGVSVFTDYFILLLATKYLPHRRYNGLETVLQCMETRHFIKHSLWEIKWLWKVKFIAWETLSMSGTWMTTNE